MVKNFDKNAARVKRHTRVRGKISGTPERPRLNVFRSLAQAIANGTLAIADDNQRAELHHAAALDGLGNTVEVHNLFDKLRRLVGALSISIVSHSSSPSY